MSVITLPGWEITDLKSLSQKGELSGVSPTVLEAIDHAESTGEGGGINGTAYGGFFGLGVTKTYPGGTSTKALLEATTNNAFEQQAVISASAFNEYLDTPRAGHTPIIAEEIYQTGFPTATPGEGAQVLEEVLGGSTVAGSSGSPGAATAFGTSSTPTAQTTGFLTVLNPGSWVGDLEHWGAVVVLVVFGLGLIGFGAWKAASPDIKQAAQTAAPLAAAA